MRVLGIGLGLASVVVILAIAGGAAAQDLVIANASTWPSNVTEGDSVNAKVTVKNVGDEPAPSSDTAIMVGRTTLLLYTGDLDPGEEATIQSRDVWEARAGNHTVTFVADAGEDQMNGAQEEVNESDEANNNLTREIHVVEKTRTAGPDLAVTEFSISPWAPSEGDMVDAEVRLVNEGRNATGNATLRLILDGESMEASRSLDRIEPGEERKVTLEGAWQATPGSHELSAHLLVPSEVGEPHGSDNIDRMDVDVDGETSGDEKGTPDEDTGTTSPSSGNTSGDQQDQQSSEDGDPGAGRGTPGPGVAGVASAVACAAASRWIRRLEER